MKNRILYALLVAAAITGGCAIVPANGPSTTANRLSLRRPRHGSNTLDIRRSSGRSGSAGSGAGPAGIMNGCLATGRRHGVDTTGFRTAGSVMVTAGARMMVDGNKAHAADHATIVVATGVNSPPASAQERTNMDQ